MGEAQLHGSSIIATRRCASFTANLQPLLVEQGGHQPVGWSVVSALNDATPHIAINQKLFTNRCKSSLLPRPATSQPATRHCNQSLALQQHQPKERCSTAPAVFQPGSNSRTDTTKLPGVLQFESWRTSGGEQQRITLEYHTATSEFHVRGPKDVWLTMSGSSGRLLNHWDLHVGAQLDFLGKPLVLKKASCATTAWLDAWAKLLLQQRQQLEIQLAKFIPVVLCQSHVAADGRGMQQGHPGQQLLQMEPSGGKVNLRHLREDVASLAWRLRQHKAVIQLPPELQDLKPQQGPAVWSLPGACPSPQVNQPTGCRRAFVTPIPKQQTIGCRSGRMCHGLAVLLPKESEGQQHGLPSLGDTPTTLNRLTALNRINLLDWLHSNPLAVSAAVDRNCYTTPKTMRPSPLTAQTPAGARAGGNLWAKTPEPASGHRFGGHLAGRPVSKPFPSE